MYQSRPHSPYQQRQPLEQQGYIGQSVLLPTGFHNIQYLPPHAMWPGHDYPPESQFFSQYKYETPRGIPPQHYRQGFQDTTSREPPVHGEPSSTNSKQPPPVFNVKSPTNLKQVPTEEKTLSGQPGQIPKKSERKGVSEAKKPDMQPTDNKKGKT